MNAIFTSAPSQWMSVKLGTRLIGPVPLEIVTDRAKAILLLFFLFVAGFWCQFRFSTRFLSVLCGQITLIFGSGS